MAKPDDLGAHLYRAIAGRSHRTEPQNFAQALGWFVRAAQGNVSLAARMMGVPRRTARDWLDGKGLGPRSAARRSAVLDSARLSVRRERLKPGREKRLRGKPEVVSEIEIEGTYVYDGGGAERTVEIGRYLIPSTMSRVIDVYLAGGTPEDLRAEFAACIDDPAGFYDRTMMHGPDDGGWSVTSVNL